MLFYISGAWLGIRRVFPGVNIKGCVFHWTQAVWRRVQEYGLVTAYRQQQPIHTYIRQLLALPFLPSAHIRDAFTSLRDRANTNQLMELVSYMDRQWFQNSVIGIADWCIFKRTVRTNNDVEGRYILKHEISNNVFPKSTLIVHNTSQIYTMPLKNVTL